MSGEGGGRPRGPWIPWVAAVLMCGVLLAAALFIRSTVRESSSLVARGMANVLALAGLEALRDAGRPPGQEALAAFLEAHREGGLRYVAGGAGAGVGGAEHPGAIGQDAPLKLENGRARVVHRLWRPRPPSPATGETAPPRAEPDGRRMRIAYEFEPLAAQDLEAQSRRYGMREE
jgi:two-component system sensor histidine kinase HydH